MLAGAILGLQSVSYPRLHALGLGLIGKALFKMRTLRILLSLFLKNRPHPMRRTAVQHPTTFGAWMSAYCRRLRQNCEKNERS
jgi:hypothetical protein